MTDLRLASDVGSKIEELQQKIKAMIAADEEMKRKIQAIKK